MKLPSLVSLISATKETVDAMMLPVKERQLRAKANLEAAKIEEAILNKQEAVNKLLLREDINFSDLLDTLDELELLERRQAQYEKVIKELFPTKSSGKQSV